MKRLFPAMLDRPESRTVVGSLTWGFFAFIVIPFFLYLMVVGMNDNVDFLVGCEIVFHFVNLVCAVFIFREYLPDAWLTFVVSRKNCVGIALAGAAMIFLTAISIAIGSSFTSVAAFSSLTIAQKELYLLAGDQVWFSPVLGSLCMVVLTPVSVSLLYYATAFAPVGVSRPWLAYLLTAFWLAVPRIADSLSFWDPAEALKIFLAQLPAHMIACWTYQKTDTVITPMLTLAFSNLLGCLTILLLLR